MNRELSSGATRSDLPIVETLLLRPRIVALLEQGLKHGLVSVVAPPGYGKTYETAVFFRKADVRLTWLRMTRMDNLPSHFWQHLVHEVKRDCPELSRRLESLGFPSTLPQMESLLRILADEIYTGRQIVLVIDKYDMIENNEVQNLLEYFIDADFENACVLVLSRKKNDLEMVAQRTGTGVFRLGEADLRFTKEEMCQFFLQKGIRLPSAAESELYAATEGWPLVTHLLTKQLALDPESYKEIQGAGLEQVNRLFEKECFSGYSDAYQNLLIRLSFLPVFTPEIVSRVGEGDVLENIQMLNDNLYTFYNHQKKRYTFKNMYREFLADKQYLIPPEEQMRIFGIAGDSAIRGGEMLSAVECYSRSERPEEMIEAMVHFIGGRMVISQAHANYLLDKLELLPPEIYQNNHTVQYIRAALYIQDLQTDKATAILEDMEKKLVTEDTPEARAMLGEVYERMAGILMMLSQERFVDYYKKASEYLPHGSAFKHKNMLRFKNYSLISMQDYKPGALDRMNKAVCDNIQYMMQVENGAFAGFDHIVLAESAYLTYDFDTAETQAYRAIFEGQAGEQHDIVCNAYFILANTACMRAHYREMADSITRIREYVEKIQVAEMDEVANYAESWFHFRMGDVDRVAPWLKTMESMNAAMMPMVIGREELLLAEYLLFKGEYSELIALLERVKDWYMAKGWGSLINANIMLAMGYYRRGDEEKALELIRETYGMTYHNGIITPYVMAGNDMRTFCGHLRQKADSGLDPQWVDNIYAKASAHAKRLGLLAKEYAQENKTTATSKQILTKKEVGVLYNLSQGFTREEIADINGVTVNTIKSTITNIYNKLGAINRADAVRLASSQGYFEQM